MNLSFAIIAHNEAHNLPACLDSIKDWRAEIVVVDCDSTDTTAKIAKTYTEQVLHRPNQAQLNINKMEAIKHCTRDWVFYLDADEQMTPKLKKEIETAIDQNQFDGYWVPRKNIIFGHWMRWGGNYPDEGLRLFRRTKGAFECKHVHEQLQVTGTVGHLVEPFIHNTYATVGQWVAKMNFYTELESDVILREKRNPWAYIFARPIYRFLRNYVKLQGFRDGKHGFIYAIMNGYYEFIAGVKALYAQKK